MKNLKIRTKLIILVGFLLIGTIALGILSLNFMSTINDSSTELAENSLPSTIAAEEMNTALSDVRIQEFKHILSQDTQEMATVMEELNTAIEAFNTNCDTYEPLIANDTDRKLLDSAKTEWENYLSISNNMIALSTEGKTEEAEAIMTGTSRESFDLLTQNCLDLVAFNKEAGDASSRQATIAYSYALKITFGLLVAFGIIAVVASILMIRSITKPVSEIDHVARKIADGQLNESINYKSKDELGVLAINFNKTVSRLRDYVNYIDEISQVLSDIADGNLDFSLTYDYAGEFAKVKTSLERISDSLNDTLSQINQSAEQVASGSDQVASGSQALSQGATEQASSIEELASTITDISNQVNETAGNANVANNRTNAAREAIDTCNMQMEKLVTAMQEINETSAEIGKIIKTIEDIAFQTNILALNAAVEAARAGEAGKGFAVVADEVRTLAGRSSDASKNTAALIEGSTRAVHNGMQIADETAHSLVAVVESAHQISDIVGRISTAAKEQADALGQVTQGVDQISSVVQTNSATAEESAAASEELSGQSQLLKSLVGRFKLKEANNKLTN